MAASLAALFKILLVIFLGTPESLRRLNLGHDALWFVAALGVQLLDLGARLRFLLRGVKENRRAILRAPVRPLTIQRVGSCSLKNASSNFSYVTCAGSKSSSTTSACPV